MTRVAGDEAARVAERARPRWGLWLCMACVITAIVIVASVMSPAIRQQWKLSLFRQNTAYTELAFYRPTALPVTAVRGKGIQVAFTITNDEGRPVSYRYMVASGSSSTLALLSSASRTVAPGDVWLVNTIVVPKCARATCRVQVTLPQQGERIDFLFRLEQPTGNQNKSKNH